MSGRFKHTTRRILVGAMLATLAACGGSGGGNDAVIQLADPGPAVETVNGQPVPQRLLDALARNRNWDLAKPEFRERALKELTGLVLVAQAAHDEKFSSDPDYAAAVELSRLQGVSAASFAEFQKRAQVDETVLRAEYDKQVEKSGGVEFDFSSLVFATEAEAIKASGEVLAGKPFEQVLEAHKKDARQARTFSHVRAAQMPEPLAQALASMKPGETTKVPVQTKFGWHVAHLNAATPITPPAYDQIKDNLRRTLLKRAGEERVAKMREAAKITLADPPPPAAPLPPRPAGVGPKPDLLTRPVAPASAESAPADPAKPKD